jgi:hypothetical protein
MSLTLGLIALRAALKVRKADLNKDFRTVLLWLTIYIPGFVSGCVGLGSLMTEAWDAWMGKSGIMIFTCFLLAFVPTIGIFFTLLSHQWLERRRQGYIPAPTSMYGQTWRALDSPTPPAGLLEELKLADRHRGNDGRTTGSKWTSNEQPTLSKDKKSKAQQSLSVQIIAKRMGKVTQQTGYVFALSTALLAVAVLGFIGVVFAFYSDFAIGAIGENMAGVPSGDNAVLFWSFFAIKRLPAFSV